MVFASGLYLRWVRIVQKTQVFAKPLDGGTANILINFGPIRTLTSPFDATAQLQQIGHSATPREKNLSPGLRCAPANTHTLHG